MALSVNTSLSNGSLNPILGDAQYTTPSAPLNVTGSSGLGLQQGNTNVSQWNTTSPQAGDNYLTGTGYTAPAQPTSYTNSYGTFTNAADAQRAAQQAADTSTYYQNQIDTLNGSLGRLDGQQQVGLGNITNSYNTALNSLDSQKNMGQRNYNDQNEQNTTSYDRNRNAIIAQTSGRANALQRLLGINGAGNSSAAYDMVPYAAGREGTQQLSDAQYAYANNQRNADRSWQDLLDNYNNGLGDLNQKKYSQENSLKQDIATTRAKLLDSLRTAGMSKDMAGGASYQTALNNQQGFTDQVNNLLNSITQLGSQYASPVIQTGGIKYNATPLQQYMLNNNGAIQGGNPAATDGIDTAFGSLFGQKRDEFGNPLA